MVEPTEEHHDEIVTLVIPRRAVPYIKSLIESGRTVAVANAEDPDPKFSKEYREYWRQRFRTLQGVLVQLS